MPMIDRVRKVLVVFFVAMTIPLIVVTAISGFEGVIALDNAMSNLVANSGIYAWAQRPITELTIGQLILLLALTASLIIITFKNKP